jgi:hypothetical protein
LLVAREARGELFERCAGIVILEKVLDPGKDGVLGRAMGLHRPSLRPPEGKG